MTNSVSVIVPCYNREDTVREAIQSVLDQDYPDFEVIAVDDNSTDGTLEQLGLIKDPRLKVVRNTGSGGVSSARNLGASLSEADWIAYQDSDDIWLPGKLRKQMEKVEGTDYVAVYCAMLVKADARPETPVQKRYPQPSVTALEGDILPALVFHSHISTQMMAVRRDVLERVGGFDEELSALVDWELMLRVAAEGPVGYVDEELVVQRMSGNSITRSNRRRLNAQEYILNKHETLLGRYPGALAWHHHRIAGAYRRFKEMDQAKRHAYEVLRAGGRSPKYVATAAYTHVLSLLS